MHLALPKLCAEQAEHAVPGAHAALREFPSNEVDVGIPKATPTKSDPRPGCITGTACRGTDAFSSEIMSIRMCRRRAAICAGTLQLPSEIV